MPLPFFSSDTGTWCTFGHFITVELDNGVSLDFDDARKICQQQYAFPVDEESFDGIFAPVKAAAIPYFADPGHRRQGEMNTLDNGRGFYSSGPSGHKLEILTRWYGSAGSFLLQDGKD